VLIIHGGCCLPVLKGTTIKPNLCDRFISQQAKDWQRREAPSGAWLFNEYITAKKEM